MINTNISIQPKYHLDRDDIVKLIQNLNKQSCAGPGGITNELLIWIADKEGDCDVAQAMNQMARTHICNRLSSQIRKLLMYANGGATLKPRKNDVRPICIIAALVRLLDKIAVENIPPDVRRAAMGPYQMVDTREGCEIGPIVADYAYDLINNITGDDENARLSMPSIRQQDKSNLAWLLTDYLIYITILYFYIQIKSQSIMDIIIGYRCHLVISRITSSVLLYAT